MIFTRMSASCKRCLSPADLADSTLIAKKFIEIKGGLWASAAYLKKNGIPKHPKELMQHSCLVFSEMTNGKLDLTDGKEELQLALKGRVVSDDLETLRVFALRGDGIAVLPEFLANDPENKTSLVRVLPKWSWGGGKFSLVYPAQRFVSPKVDAFIQVATGSRF